MTNMELIDLTLNEIRRSAQRINDVGKEAAINNAYKGSETLRLIGINNEKKLEEIRVMLRSILENVANYQNNCDEIEQVDEAIGKVAYDLIYERKRDKDFDNIKESIDNLKRANDIREDERKRVISRLKEEIESAKYQREKTGNYQDPLYALESYLNK